MDLTLYNFGALYQQKQTNVLIILEGNTYATDPASINSLGLHYESFPFVYYQSIKLSDRKWKQKIRLKLCRSSQWKGFCKLFFLIYMLENLLVKIFGNTFEEVYFKLSCRDATDNKLAKYELLHRYFSKTDQRFQNTYLTGHLWVNVSDFDHTLLDLKLSWFIILLSKIN